MNEYRTGEAGRNLIRESESLHDGNLEQIGLQPKLCPAGIWTVGWGHALYYEGKPLLVDDYDRIDRYFPQFSTMTIDQANRLFDEDLLYYEKLVRKYIKIKVNQNQFDALISFFFNCGYSQTLCSLINSKSPIDLVGKWWKEHYISVNGTRLKGLVIRREREFRLYIS